MVFVDPEDYYFYFLINNPNLIILLDLYHKYRITVTEICAFVNRIITTVLGSFV